MVFSSSGVIAMSHNLSVFHYLIRQLIWVALGLLVMCFFYYFDYQKLQKLSPFILAFSFLLVILVLIPGIGVKVNGSRRWIGYGPLRFQPSEFARLALIIYMASMLEKKKDLIRKFSTGLLPALLIMGIFLVLIVVEPDLGAPLVIGIIVFLIWFVAGAKLLHLITLGLSAVPCGIVLVLIEPYRVKRLLSFLNPLEYAQTSGFQLCQSLISVGSGGIYGLGLGKGLQKYLYLSEAHSDFIFAIICEELGFIGAVSVLLLYGILLWQGGRVAIKTPDFFGSLLATGITAMIGIAVMINVSVVLGCLPTKGLALPLLSYGGSSMLINMAALGILLNISKHKDFVVGKKAAIPEPYTFKHDYRN